MDKSLILNKLILHYAEGSTTKFAKMLGISQQALSNWKNRGTLDYEKIYTICDSLNPHWLLTGEGEMLLTENVNKSVNKTEKCKQPNDMEEKMDAEKERFYRRLEEMEKREEARDFVLRDIADTLKEIKKELKDLHEHQEEDRHNSQMCG